MIINTFTPQSGQDLVYNCTLSLLSGNFIFGFGYSGTGTGDPLQKKVFFSGESGKVSNGDAGFFYGYMANADLTISCNIFTGYHSFFIKDEFTSSFNSPPAPNYLLIKNDAPRETGAINCLFYNSRTLENDPTLSASGLVSVSLYSAY